MHSNRKCTEPHRKNVISRSTGTSYPSVQKGLSYNTCTERRTAASMTRPTFHATNPHSTCAEHSNRRPCISHCSLPPLFDPVFFGLVLSGPLRLPMRKVHVSDTGATVGGVRCPWEAWAAGRSLFRDVGRDQKRNCRSSLVTPPCTPSQGVSFWRVADTEAAHESRGCTFPQQSALRPIKESKKMGLC